MKNNETKIMPECLLGLLLFWPLLVFWGLMFVFWPSDIVLAMKFLGVGFFGEIIYLPMFLWAFAEPSERGATNR